MDQTPSNFRRIGAWKRLPLGLYSITLQMSYFTVVGFQTVNTQLFNTFSFSNLRKNKALCVKREHKRYNVRITLRRTAHYRLNMVVTLWHWLPVRQ